MDDQKVIYIKGRRFGLNTIIRYEEQLNALREEEKKMNNPLLKEWFLIRNKIRALERKIREMKNGKID